MTSNRVSRIPVVFQAFRALWAILFIFCAALAGPAWAAVSVDFRQDANNDAGFSLGEAHWINSIVQSSNAVYFEGMGLAQRVVLKDLPGTNAAGTTHSLTFGHQWTKGGTHAFDFLMSWEQAEATGTAELSAYMGGGISQEIIAFKDGIEIAASMLPVSTALTNGANWMDVTVPNDAYISKDGSTQDRIDDFEGTYGNRTIRLFANAPIVSATLSNPVHSVANGADTGDSTVSYTLTWITSAKSTQAVVWMAAHIAVGNDSPTLLGLAPGGWGDGLGASQISGGPYHFTLDRADGARLGNQDNQLKGSDIRALPECALIGPSSVCPGSTDEFSITSEDPEATFEWYFEGDPNGASFVGGVNTGSTVQVQAGTACDSSYRICVTVTDSTGLTNSCCITVTVDDNTDPTASNPDPVTVECADEVPAPDITVVDDEDDNCDENLTVAFEGDVSDGNTCPEVITRTYSVTDDCGNSIDVTQTITVNDTTDPTASDPDPISVQCADEVPVPDITVVDDEADNCGTPVVAFVSDSPVGTCPTVITRTYSVTDACGNSINVTQTITVNDTTDPTASDPAPVTVQCLEDVPPPDITDVTDEADNCDDDLTVAFVSDVSDNNTCPEVITRTYSVTDDCGNSINVTQTITIDDDTPPVPTCAAEATVTIAEPTATDNCGGTPSVVFSRSDGLGATDPYPIGSPVTVTFTVTDACGNTSTCEYVVNISSVPAS